MILQETPNDPRTMMIGILLETVLRGLRKCTGRVGRALADVINSVSKHIFEYISVSILICDFKII